MKTLARTPVVPHRDLPLSEQDHDRQVKRGLFITERGEPQAIPADKLSEPRVFKGVDLWRQTPEGLIYRKGTKARPHGTRVHKRVLAFLRDNVHRDIPYLYYNAVLGHDLHVSTYANLFGRQWHAGWTSPFVPGDQHRPLDPSFHTLRLTHWVDHTCDLTPCPSAIFPQWGDMLALLNTRGGFVEELGWLSGAKVTDAFVSEEIDELVSTTGTEYADFDFHEVGTSNTAEDNSHTALQTTTSIARATGTPTDADPIYRNVATITADTGETWQEHGIFNNSSGAAMMDRNLTGGQAVVASDQVQYTFELTKDEEA